MLRPIAVLDSGVGGLTVVKELLATLPQEEIVYYGDTARAPYGPRPKNEIKRFTRQIVNLLLTFNPKLIIIACNTATAVALEEMQCHSDVPVIGVIEPGAIAAVRVTKTGYIGVIGTEGTINSKAYSLHLRCLSSEINIIDQACPAFVPLVEKGEYRSEIAYRIVYEAIHHMRSYPIDCLILGCTHYPFLASTIAKVMGEEVKLIHSAEETASQAKKIIDGSYATTEYIEHVDATQGKRKHYFICSGQVEPFQGIVEEWMAEELKGAELIYIKRPADLY